MLKKAIIRPIFKNPGLDPMGSRFPIGHGLCLMWTLYQSLGPQDKGIAKEQLPPNREVGNVIGEVREEPVEDRTMEGEVMR